jgi:ribonuclease-3
LIIVVCKRFSMPDITSLLKALGVKFKNIELLRQALVHSSYINENPDFSPGHNERLELLGDAVLGLVVAGELYRSSPDLSEGEMTRLRAALVKRDTLARVAQSIGLGDFLYLGKGEEAGGGRNKPNNLAGVLESIVGAVYLDRGLSIARNTAMRLLADEWSKLEKRGTEAGTDFKSRLQQIVQSRFQQTPSYHLATATGPPHDPVFTVEVSFDGRVVASGSGRSKKLAETAAAREALERLGGGFTS